MIFTKGNKKGFTIIEVLIVLAIAGTIMLVVFLAVPALQRNARNTRRRSDASHLMGLVSEFIANNNGTAPTGFGTGATQLNLTDESFSILSTPTGNISASANPFARPAASGESVFVYTNLICKNNNPSYSTTGRAIAIVYYLEPNNILQCVDS